MDVNNRILCSARKRSLWYQGYLGALVAGRYNQNHYSTNLFVLKINWRNTTNR